MSEGPKQQPEEREILKDTPSPYNWPRTIIAPFAIVFVALVIWWRFTRFGDDPRSIRVTLLAGAFVGAIFLVRIWFRRRGR
jgi:hypothetical protein